MNEKRSEAMPNIMLTYRCNLNCSYCFANEFVNAKDADITEDNFVKALQFLTTSDNRQIGLIGGEPTIHPKFDKFIKYICDESKVEIAIVYTNGLQIGKFVELLEPLKFRVLVNCNSPDNTGDKYYSLVSNLEKLFMLPYARKRVDLGINLYSNDMNYSYIFDLATKFDVHRLRMSITVPIGSENRKLEPMKYFKSRKDFVLQFMKDCDKYQIVPYYDCNVIPNCIWEEADKKWIQEFVAKYKVKRTNLTGACAFCKPVVDILPDLQAIRCLGLSEFMKLNISDFNSLGDLNDYYVNMIDVYAHHIYETKECEECYERKIMRCTRGCLAFMQDYLREKSEYYR